MSVWWRICNPENDFDESPDLSMYIVGIVQWKGNRLQLVSSRNRKHLIDNENGAPKEKLNANNLLVNKCGDSLLGFEKWARSPQ